MPAVVVLGGWLAVNHLVERGHRRVAFIGGAMNIGQVRERLEGARAAWAEAAQAELDKPLHAPRPMRLPAKPTAKDLIAFVYDELAKATKPEATSPKLRSVK